jgi:hypothetical protein
LALSDWFSSEYIAFAGSTASALKAIALLRRLAAALLLTQTEVPSSLDVTIRRFMPSTPQLARKSGSIQQADRYMLHMSVYVAYCISKRIAELTFACRSEAA